MEPWKYNRSSSYTIDSGGTCFICLKLENVEKIETEKKNNYFRLILRYLQLPPWRYFPSNEIKRFKEDVQVNLCDTCEQIVKEFGEIYTIFEETLLHLNASITKIHEAMNSLKESDNMELEKFEDFRNFREEIMLKCEEMVRCSLPRVRLEHVPNLKRKCHSSSPSPPPVPEFRIKYEPFIQDEEPEEAEDTFQENDDQMSLSGSSSPSSSSEWSMEQLPKPTTRELSKNTTKSDDFEVDQRLKLRGRISCPYCVRIFEGSRRDEKFKIHLATFHRFHFFSKIQKEDIPQDEFVKMIDHVINLCSNKGKCSLCPVAYNIKNKGCRINTMRQHLIQHHLKTLEKALLKLQDNPELLNLPFNIEEDEEDRIKENEKDKKAILCQYCGKKFEKRSKFFRIKTHLSTHHREHFFPNVGKKSLTKEAFLKIIDKVLLLHIEEANCALCPMRYTNNNKCQQISRVKQHLLEDHQGIIEKALVKALDGPADSITSVKIEEGDKDKEGPPAVMNELAMAWSPPPDSPQIDPCHSEEEMGEVLELPGSQPSPPRSSSMVLDTEPAIIPEEELLTKEEKVDAFEVSDSRPSSPCELEESTINTGGESPNRMTTTSMRYQISCQYCDQIFKGRTMTEKSKQHLITSHIDRYLPNFKEVNVTQTEFLEMVDHVLQLLIKENNCSLCTKIFSNKFRPMQLLNVKLHLLEEHQGTVGKAVRKVQDNPELLNTSFDILEEEEEGSPSHSASQSAPEVDVDMDLDHLPSPVSPHEPEEEEEEEQAVEPVKVQDNPERLKKKSRGTIGMKQRLCQYCQQNFEFLNFHIIKRHVEHFFPNIKNENVPNSEFVKMIEHVLKLCIKADNCSLCPKLYRTKNRNSQLASVRHHLLREHQKTLEKALLKVQENPELLNMSFDIMEDYAEGPSALINKQPPRVETPKFGIIEPTPGSGLSRFSKSKAEADVDLTVGLASTSKMKQILCQYCGKKFEGLRRLENFRLHLATHHVHHFFRDIKKNSVTEAEFTDMIVKIIRLCITADNCALCPKKYNVKHRPMQLLNVKVHIIQDHLKTVEKALLKVQEGPDLLDANSSFPITEDEEDKKRKFDIQKAKEELKAKHNILCQQCGQKFEGLNVLQRFRQHQVISHVEIFFPNIRKEKVPEAEFTEMIDHVINLCIKEGNCSLCSKTYRKGQRLKRQLITVKMHLLRVHIKTVEKALFKVQNNPDLLKTSFSIELDEEDRKNEINEKQVKCQHCGMKFEGTKRTERHRYHIMIRHKEQLFPNIKKENMTQAEFVKMIDQVILLHGTNGRCSLCLKLFRCKSIGAQLFGLKLHLLREHRDTLEKALIKAQDNPEFLIRGIRDGGPSHPRGIWGQLGIIPGKPSVCPFCKDKRKFGSSVYLKFHVFRKHKTHLFPKNRRRESVTEKQFQIIIDHLVFVNFIQNSTCSLCSKKIDKKRESEWLLRMKLHVFQKHHETVMKRLEEIQKDSELLRRIDKCILICKCGVLCMNKEAVKRHRKSCGATCASGGNRK